jgi:hypothetical protein
VRPHLQPFALQLVRQLVQLRLLLFVPLFAPPGPLLFVLPGPLPLLPLIAPPRLPLVVLPLLPPGPLPLLPLFPLLFVRLVPRLFASLRLPLVLSAHQLSLHIQTKVVSKSLTHT